MREIIIKKNDAGQRFDKFLAKYMPDAPKSFFYKMLRKKNITLNGKKSEGDTKLNEGDIVKLFLADETIDNFRKTKEEKNNEFKKAVTGTIKQEFEIIYEDDDIILLNKPVGVLSQKAKDTDISLVEMLISYLLDNKKLNICELESFKPSVCNRLDRNTSGIVAAGKSLAGLQMLSEIFRNKSIEKYYYAITSGKISGFKSVDSYLYKDETKNQVKLITLSEYAALSENEKASYVHINTAYSPISSSEDFTFLKIKLNTGKTHQIRAHLAYMGNPVIGDYKYGNRNKNQIIKNEYKIDYQMLHAGELVFPKLTGKFKYLSERKFEAPLPEKFKELKEALSL